MGQKVATFRNERIQIIGQAYPAYALLNRG
ncbi:hypothetical protein SPHS6_01246 [Sphingobium sp. S6]|nr:hypothetical protein SPHS6_01246 [Sphingobium sp. S6]CAD7336949.1 hypothetical protein SPHS8_01283 [Sphingobium sp. S8]